MFERFARSSASPHFGDRAVIGQCLGQAFGGDAADERIQPARRSHAEPTDGLLRGSNLPAGPLDTFNIWALRHSQQPVLGSRFHRGFRIPTLLYRVNVCWITWLRSPALLICQSTLISHRVTG